MRLDLGVERAQLGAGRGLAQLGGAALVGRALLLERQVLEPDPGLDEQVLDRVQRVLGDRAGIGEPRRRARGPFERHAPPQAAREPGLDRGPHLRRVERPEQLASRLIERHAPHQGIAPEQLIEPALQALAQRREDERHDQRRHHVEHHRVLAGDGCEHALRAEHDQQVDAGEHAGEQRVRQALRHQAARIEGRVVGDQDAEAQLPLLPQGSRADQPALPARRQHVDRPLAAQVLEAEPGPLVTQERVPRVAPGVQSPPLLPQRPRPRRRVDDRRGLHRPGRPVDDARAAHPVPQRPALRMVRHPQQVSQDAQGLVLVSPPQGRHRLESAARDEQRGLPEGRCRPGQP